MESFVLTLFAYTGYAFLLAQAVALAIASVLVMRDRSKIENTIGTDYKLTLGPVRWALIVFFTGGFGLALYWFVTYHPLLLTKLVDEK